ncbi:MAG: SRPBCC family protein [Bacteroidaceae bacterium]|nr:SRPBCC family protein [Bacteroidaceae bacterium]
MTKYESTVKQIHFPQSSIFAKLADLRNLESLKERVNDPAFLEHLRASGQVPEDKLAQIQEMASKLEFTADSVSIVDSPIGNVALQIVEREEPKCIKFEVQGAPMAANLWIQLLPTSAYESKMKCTIGADLNFFLKQMAKKPLQEGVEKLADMLAMIPYGF